MASELATTYASFISGRLATPCRAQSPSLSVEAVLTAIDLKKKKDFYAFRGVLSPACLVREQGPWQSDDRRPVDQSHPSLSHPVCSNTLILLHHRRLWPSYNLNGTRAKGKHSAACKKTEQDSGFMLWAFMVSIHTLGLMDNNWMISISRKKGNHDFYFVGNEK